MKLLSAVILLLSANVSFAEQCWEVLIPNVQQHNNTIVITVISNGCTKKYDFSIVFGDDLSMMVTRLKLDVCRAWSHMVEFSYSFEELGLRMPPKLL